VVVYLGNKKWPELIFQASFVLLRFELILQRSKVPPSVRLRTPHPLTVRTVQTEAEAETGRDRQRQAGIDSAPLAPRQGVCVRPLARMKAVNFKHLFLFSDGRAIILPVCGWDSLQHLPVPNELAREGADKLSCIHGMFLEAQIQI
jgi:hypothetical protein